MSKKLVTATMMFLLIVIVSQTLICSIDLASAAVPTKLQIYVGPTSVPADNQAYECLAVQLQDSKGNPARAEADTTISLASTAVNIGNVVSPTVTIRKGTTYATAKFQTTYSPGSTTITATASSYATVQATVTTVGPIPSTLVVYGYPPVLPADSKSYDETVVVQLQDSSGAPAKAPNEGVQVTLSSSNTAIGTVEPAVTIKGGETFALTTFTTTNTAGTTSITAVASGYTSKQATFTTKQTATAPTALKIYLSSPKIPADDSTYKQVAVELQSSSGVIARAAQDIQITLASSAEDIGTIEKTIIVPEGETYALANFDTTYKAGTTTVTATATDCKTTQENIVTVGAVPSKLAVYSLPAALPADAKTYNTIQVQLQDSSGKPAKDPDGNVIVSLFSSTSNGGDVTPKQLTIPFGKTSAAANFTSTYEANSTSITAQASGYATGQTKITTYLVDPIPLNITVTASPAAIKAGSKANITAYVTYMGVQSASGATVAFSSSKGVNFTKVAYQGDGCYTTTVSVPASPAKTNYTITVNATKTGYTLCAMNTTLIVGADQGDLGTLRLHINQGNNPVSDATITSTTQPNGAKALSGITNQTGDVTFMNVMVGVYTIQVTKDGYQTLENTIVLGSGQTATRSLTLTANSSPLTLIIVIVAAAVIGAVVAVLIIRRRKTRKKVFQKKTTIEFIQ